MYTCIHIWIYMQRYTQISINTRWIVVNYQWRQKFAYLYWRDKTKITVSHWTCWEHLTKIKEQYLDCFECIMIYISLHHKKLRHKTDLEWALRGTVVNQNNKQSMLFNVKTRHIDCIIIYTWMFIQSYDTQYPRVHADKKRVEHVILNANHF